MLRTLHIPSLDKRAARLVSVALFTLLMIVSAKMSLEIGPVPFTMQVLVVLLSGMVLGSRDGALSQIAYISLVAANLPVDARGIGSAAFFGPTGGYLLGFALAAFITGWLVENSQDRVWQRWIAGVTGIVAIYALGTPLLKLYFDLFRDGATWQDAWTWGVASFILPDLVKALIAATLVEGMRALLMRGDSAKD